MNCRAMFSNSLIALWIIFMCPAVSEGVAVTGVITSFCLDPHQSWLAVGTSSGCHVCWDLRFQLPISTIDHPFREYGNVEYEL